MTTYSSSKVICKYKYLTHTKKYTPRKNKKKIFLSQINSKIKRIFTSDKKKISSDGQRGKNMNQLYSNPQMANQRKSYTAFINLTRMQFIEQWSQQPKTSVTLLKPKMAKEKNYHLLR